MRATRRSVRGLTIPELLVVVLVLLMLAGAGIPVIKAATCDVLKNTSIHNLQRLNIAHAMYAADWNDRQFTLVRDDLGALVDSTALACEQLLEAGECHPPVILGEDCGGVLKGWFFGCKGQPDNCSQFFVVPPINFPGDSTFDGFGSFRLPNARGFHEYVNGRFFDPVFYAPKDAPIYEEVRPFFDIDCEFVSEGSDVAAFSSSYALSPAAMYHPDVLSLYHGHYFRHPADFDEGFQSPTVSQALYPPLKTRMVEHNWLQNPPEPCNNAFFGCVPYYFNHGHNSVPMTLFFDGHINGLSPSEAIRAEDRIMAQTGGDAALWSRDTPFGSSGYFSSDGWDWVNTSYHILTVDGIRGRDTLAPP